MHVHVIQAFSVDSLLLHISYRQQLDDEYLIIEL